MKAKKIETSVQDTVKYKNAKRILKVWKECPDFLYGLVSGNEYDNKKGIEKKFNKIVNDYENHTWYICPKCSGKKGKSVDAGYGAYGEPCSDWVRCTYCNGKGKLNKETLMKLERAERKQDEKELERLQKKLKN